ncbi:MAG TPA: hypothetical protein DD436_01925 [Erythrobacter sp.]|jgi:hypothetical protein|nr:hypothetical protein [Erythrobacter sp.]|tara:strand:- start:321 stop:1256 length:936 start_codon:yes stop_codon:yes gene_type:complete
MASITLTDKEPRAPRADFGFEIDFQRGVGPASRVFTATRDFIKVCEALDDELIRSIDSNIETVLVLEDIESGSIKTWLRNALAATEDDALKTLDWKPLVGKYLVRAKYAVIRWIDDDSAPRSLPDLRRELQQIAQDTDVRHLPDYTPPSPGALVEAVKGFQGVKDSLLPGDKARLLSDEGSIPFDLTISLNVEDIEALAVARSIEVPPAEMILPVKKPDYLGSSQWELRHGKRNIYARIEDEAWLRRFQSRQEDVRPGDALRSIVQIEYNYGFDNELISERFTVLEVLEVLVNRVELMELPFEDGDDGDAS